MSTLPNLNTTTYDEFLLMLSRAFDEWIHAIKYGTKSTAHDKKQDVLSLLNAYAGENQKIRQKVHVYLDERTKEAFSE